MRKMDQEKLGFTEFVGRDEEMGELLKAWGLASEGTPQLRVIVADSGYGKTRLVQAFYERLSAEYDVVNYWPKRLQMDSSSNLVMPDMRLGNANREIPWFWWGVRFKSPEDRNPLTDHCVLLASLSDPNFVSHYKAIALRLDVAEAEKQIANSLIKSILGVIPVASFVSSVYNAGSDLLELRQITLKLHEAQDQAENRSKLELAERKKVLEMFTVLQEKAGPNKAGLPVVLFLDDAQWMDDITLRMLQQVWEVANEKKWRLLIVATHWQTEWLLQDRSSEGTSFALWAERQCQSLPETSNMVSIGQLEESELNVILSTGLSGLSEWQQSYFIKQSKRNPRFLVEVTLNLRAHPEWFVDSDVRGELTPNGFERAKTETVDIAELEGKRFLSASEEVKLALGFSSLQGDVFLRQFTLDLAQALHATEVSLEGLRKAESPFVLAESLDSARMEFRSYGIFNKSAGFFRDYLLALPEGMTGGSAPSRAIALIATVQQWIAQDRLSQLDHRAESLLLERAIETAALLRDDKASAILVLYLSRRSREVEAYRRAPTVSVFLKDVAERMLLEFDAGHTEDFRELSLERLELAEFMLETSQVEEARKALGDLVRSVPVETWPALAARAHQLLSQAHFQCGDTTTAVKVAERGLKIPGLDGTVAQGKLLYTLGMAQLSEQMIIEAANNLEHAICVLGKVERKFGAMHAKAVFGMLQATLALRESGGDPEEVEHFASYLDSTYQARSLDAHVPKARGEEPATLWQKAASSHDFALSRMAVNSLRLREWAKDSEVRWGIGSAMELWAETPLRVGLSIRTKWLWGFLIICSDEAGGDDALRTALAWLERERGADHAETALVRELLDSPRPWESTTKEDLLRRVLKVGWINAD